MPSTTIAGGTTAAAAAAASPPPPNHNYLTNLGFGYAIAIALGFLVLLSTILLASYVCCRTRRAQRHHHRQRHHRRSSSSRSSHPNANAPDGVVLPRIIFVAEDEDGDGGGGDDESAAVGLDPAVINSYPKFPFRKAAADLGNSEAGLCSICLCEYKDSEMLRMMPDCRHFFHLLCLDAWLKLNGSCPVCRNSPLPTPLSTPLAEVVPLSQYQR